MDSILIYRSIRPVAETPSEPTNLLAVRSMTRLPRAAEKFFSLCCTQGGAVATRPDEDVNGWDYMVEMPPSAWLGAIEDTPASRIAFTQIKATKGSRASVRIKLSNILKAARSQQPWFLFLVQQVSGGYVLYGQHFWKDLMYKGLMEIRKAGLSGTPLHRRFLNISFHDSHMISADLVQWIASCIDSCGAHDYADEKLKLSNSLGYESGCGNAFLTVECATKEELCKAFLGSGDGLDVSSFKFVPSRFDLPDVSPKLEWNSGKIFISPAKAHPCVLSFKSARSPEPIVLPGSAFFAKGISADTEISARLSAGTIDIFYLDAGRQEVTFNLPLEASFGLGILLSTLQIHKQMTIDSVKVTVSGISEFCAHGEFKLSRDRALPWTDAAIADLVALKKLADRVHHSDVKVSLRDFQDSSRQLSLFRVALHQGTLAVECDAASELPEGPTCFVYYSKLQFGNSNFEVVVRRPLLKDETKDGRRWLTGDLPQLLDVRVADAAVKLTPDIDQVYERNVAELVQEEVPIELGDLSAFMSNQPIVS